MRKIITFSLFIFLFSMLSGSAFASNVDACDAVKEKGLHGLCVAWHNANPKNQDKIAEKYLIKSGGDSVPGSEPDLGDTANCPCTDGGEMASWDVAAYCEEGVGYDDVYRVDSSGILGTLWLTAVDDGMGYACTKMSTHGGYDEIPLDSASEYNICVDEIVALREGLNCLVL